MILSAPLCTPMSKAVTNDPYGMVGLSVAPVILLGIFEIVYHRFVALMVLVDLWKTLDISLIG